MTFDFFILSLINLIVSHTTAENFNFTSTGFNLSEMATSPDAICRGHAYPGYLEDRELLNSIYNYTEVPVSLVRLILTSLIIITSIYGKIDGTFKWCVFNIPMLHLL